MFRFTMHQRLSECFAFYILLDRSSVHGAFLVLSFVTVKMSSPFKQALVLECPFLITLHSEL